MIVRRAAPMRAHSWRKLSPVGHGKRAGSTSPLTEPQVQLRGRATMNSMHSLILATRLLPLIRGVVRKQPPRLGKPPHRRGGQGDGTQANLSVGTPASCAAQADEIYGHCRMRRAVAELVAAVAATTPRSALAPAVAGAAVWPRTQAMAPSLEAARSRGSARQPTPSAAESTTTRRCSCRIARARSARPTATAAAPAC